MFECLTLSCSSFISSLTQLWSEHKAGSVLGLEVQKTVVRLLQMTSCLQKRRQHFMQQLRIQTGGDGPSARDCFQQRSDPYLVLSLVLLCLSRLFVGALSHFVFTPSFKPHVSLPQSEASISDLPGTLSSAKGFLLAGSVCTCSVVSRLRPVIIKKGQGWTADGREVADHNSRRLLEPLLSGDFTWRCHKVRINC